MQLWFCVGVWGSPRFRRAGARPELCLGHATPSPQSSCALIATASAVKYLVNYSRKRHWPQKPEEEVESTVEDVFLEADVGFLASLADMENPADAKRTKPAKGDGSRHIVAAMR